MALVACKECGKQISTDAKVCPSCGAVPPKKTSKLTMILGGVFCVFVIAQVASHVRKESTPSPPVRVKTPEELKAEAAKEAAFRRVVLTMQAIKQSLREPDSVVWELVRANDDASVICLEYRARNGFGGLNYEHATVKGGKISREPGVWNRDCKGALPDFTYARHAL